MNGLFGVTGLKLQNNGGDELPIASDGTFSFATQLASGANYAVTVKAQPDLPTRVCYVSNGTGTVSTAPVVNVVIRCAGPAARFAYVVNNGSNTVSAYAIDGGTGALNALVGAPFSTGSQPARIAADPVGRFVYVTNATSVWAYTVDAGTGALSPLAGAPVSAPASNGIAVDPKGRFAYTVGSGIVSAFAIDASSGALSLAGAPISIPTATLGSPNFVTVDPLGKFVYVTCENGVGGGAVIAYSIDAGTGALSPVPGSPLVAGFFPRSSAVDPAGRFAYVTDYLWGLVSAYAMDASTGALHSVAGGTTVVGSGAYRDSGGPIPLSGSGPTSVAVDPTGRFAYVASGFEKKVYAYSTESSTGALVPLAGAPVATGNAPQHIVVDPTGQFAYVVNSNSTVSAYMIDASSGALSPMAVPTVPTGASPRSIALSR
ncbi:beta-propeller fold lactonase family protein [Variovorax sp. J22P271]|uniref:lactonase family protein n=1 Tax=Variovorax davisae TaxID=3053515 RepID=UPI0025762A8F|nr:beta-propeller fold lactonase family protein [Variovorax sp. J22P271]MDM0032843.1 beta-propeller fold lactonase family protein [Variovorax sp. J22P271]